MKIKTSLFGYVAPTVPQELKFKVISREEPSAAPLPPEDLVTALFVLSHDRDAKVSESAKTAFTALSNETLTDALNATLDPLVIKAIVDARKDNEAILTLAALSTDVDDTLLCWIAENCQEAVLQLMSEDRTQFIARPGFLDAVRKNPSINPALMGRLMGVAVAAATATAGDDKTDSPYAQKDDLNPEEKQIFKAILTKKVKEEEHNLYKLVSKLSVSQKVKLALSGNKSARELLVKESNKLVCGGVLKNPRITDDEILKLATTKGTSEDILRTIAGGRKWLEKYSIRFAVVTNPKTPTTLSIKILSTLNDVDVQKVAKSKNVASVLAGSAKRIIDAKAKKR